ncbi:MAG: IS630 family transposase [Desulfobacteraceae bacterium]|nr:IS630 family transposase [Planctomycetota bacterium]MBL7178003.1 IS630 family transposase [Desulfobacteraceae bacterium]MBU0990460.1 IS630 family transposase [Pseudomonadota bacterium]
MQLRVLLQHKIPETTISSVLGCHVKTVFKWKQRFQTGDGILDRPRSGRPSIIPPEVNHRLLAFYCQYNPLPGYTRWSIRWAETYLQKHLDILQCPISRSSIHRLLKSNSLKPYRNKYFLQICDPDFFPKMEKIIKAYQRAYPYLFCLDECTGLQALERKAPRLPAQGDRPEYIEPEYVRHGTVSILSILQVSTGQVFTECIPDHTSSTITSSIRNHILQYDRSAELHYICDNYSSHSTEEFCLGIADLCGLDLPKLKTAHDRRQWLQSPEKRIIFHFLPTHGSWLNLIEIWFGILQQKALKDESFLSTTDLKNRIISFTETWDSDFAHPFKFSYSGEGLHEKVISRFTKWLQMHSPQLNVKFLEKQLRLISNLATSYWPKAKRKAWNVLYETLQGNNDFITAIIGTGKDLSAQLINLSKLLHCKLKAT